MSNKLTGQEYPLAKIFSSDFSFVIPSYQRPYSWTEEETDTLFNDLYNFYTENDKDENYFLGSIVLIKEEDKPYSQVIDGQQRLTTLTILLAVLTSKLSGGDFNDYKNYIIEPGRASQGLQQKPRLCLRERDNDFFYKYIQEINFDELYKLEPNIQDTEAKTNIIKNTKLILKRINECFCNSNDSSKIDIKKLLDFGKFLCNNCYIVTVSTPAVDSAFRVFSVLNDRGMSLLATDIFKANIIGVINDSDKQKYTDKWDNMEAELTRNGFNDLFTHIRMIKMRCKAKKTLQEEFSQKVLPNPNNNSAIDFIDNTLEPYSIAYSVIKRNDYMSTSNAEKVNNILRWLNRIDNSDWIPVAMFYYVKNKDNSLAIYKFLIKLERLAVYMRVMSWDINHRIERYTKVINDIESATDDGFGNSINLRENEVKDFINQLNSDIYTMVSIKRNYLILRLDSFVSDNAAIYESKILTIEHVLPQTVNTESEWSKKWPDIKVREKWIHKIGNLVPLSKRKNSEAQNYDFGIKKEKYFKGKSGISSYALTTQVLKESEWTPKIVEKRQKELIEAFIKGWELNNIT